MNLTDPFLDDVPVVDEKPEPKKAKPKKAKPETAPVVEQTYTPSVYDVPEPTPGSVFACWAIQQLLHETLSNVIEVSYFDAIQIGDFDKFWNFLKTVRISLQRESVANPRRARLCNQLLNATGNAYRQGMDTDSLGALYGVLIDEPRPAVAREEFKHLVLTSIPALQEEADDAEQDMFDNRAKFDQVHAAFVETLK